MNGLVRTSGEILKFKLPVLVLGSHATADVELPAAEPMHCLIAPTPFGPALRAFETTHINNAPIAAALLKHGDVLRIGDESFTVQWTAETPVKTSEEPDTLKTAVREKLAAIESRYREAQELRIKTRAAAAKYLKQQRAEMHALRQKQIRETCESEQQIKYVQESLKQLQDEHARLKSEAETTNARMAAAWESLTSAQRDLASERQQSEAYLAHQLQLVEQQKAQLAAREATIGTNETTTTAKVANLQAEIAGLEQRALHARMVLEDLETQRRQKAAMPEAKVDDSDWTTPVPLKVKNDNRTADQLMMTLRQQEAELAKERQRLNVQLQNAATEREQLNDQRLLVTEQIRQLEASRRQWQQGQSQTIGELETLAHKLAHREAELNLREQGVARLEQDHKARHDQLAETRKAVEAWQAALTQQESRFVQDRQAAEQTLARRESEVQRRENETNEFFARWESRYAEACTTAQDDARQFAELRDLMLESVRECGLARDKAMADVQKLTSRLLALTDVKTALSKKPETRRKLRLARRRWNKRLKVQVQGIESKQAMFETALASAAERLMRIQTAHRALMHQTATRLERDRLPDPVILPFAATRTQGEEIILLTKAA